MQPEQTGLFQNRGDVLDMHEVALGGDVDDVYREALGKLANMGFGDTELNLSLLQAQNF